MSIMWKYLDKRSATIAAIKDYDAMQFIINSTDDEIKRVHEKMTSVGSPKWDGMPRTHNPQAGEERILKAIDEIDILKERYRQAVEYMDWFKPAWEQLSDDDRYCLETFYGDGNTYGSSAVYYIAEYLHIEHLRLYGMFRFIRSDDWKTYYEMSEQVMNEQFPNWKQNPYIASLGLKNRLFLRWYSPITAWLFHPLINR